MAKKKHNLTTGEPTFEGTIVLPPVESNTEDNTLETTGRFIVIFKEEASEAKTMHNTLREITNVNSIASSSDYENGVVTTEALSSNEITHFERLGIAIVSEGSALESLSASVSEADSPIMSIEPEYFSFLSDDGLTVQQAVDFNYLRGYRDAVNHLYEKLIGQSSDAITDADISAVFSDTAQFTWGLQATGVNLSSFSGQGIRVAILDTGFDFQHPDFLGRTIISETFTNFPVQDIHGHGTHCVGTACGPKRPATGVRRYGVAYNSQIYVGKIFNHDQPKPRAPNGSIIAGIDWATGKGCQVVSLSVGSPINQQLVQFEEPIRRALNAGTLVVAAAGNNATRPANPGFVERPANADAAMAVAAVDNRLRIASFSGRSSTITGEGGKVNIAGPGVSVFSSVPVGNGRHIFLDGTSMATPHVAGIAALWAESTGLTGVALWNRLIQSALPLSLPTADVGSGLVQAPR